MSLAELTAGSIDPAEIADIDEGDGYATLLVLDPFALVMNNWILNVINDNQQCRIAHIVASTTPQEADRLLDTAFGDYVRGCCYSLGCDATVEYIVGGQVVMTKEYGWDDGSYSMTFKVYCESDELDLLATCLGNASDDSPLIVVTTDLSSSWGFAAHKSVGSSDALEDAHDFLHNG